MTQQLLSPIRVVSCDHWSVLLLQIHEAKYNFNQKVLALRDSKMTIVDQVTQYIQELMDIKASLGPNATKPIPAVPVMHPDELPER